MNELQQIGAVILLFCALVAWAAALVWAIYEYNTKITVSVIAVWPILGLLLLIFG